MPSSSRKPSTCRAALPAGRVLAARGAAWPGRRAAGPPTAPSPSPSRSESASNDDRLLHRGQRQQLQQVVLDHVAGRADAVVVPGPAADPDVLGHGDLHVVDVAAVPDRLVHLVGEAQRQDVLHRLLAEVVVDAEHRLRREDRRPTIAFSSRALARSWPNGFSITTRRQAGRPPPESDRPDSLELLDHGGEGLRRDRQVERVVAAGAALGVELVDAVGQLVERRVVVELAGHEPDALAELLPDRRRGTACARAP